MITPKLVNTTAVRFPNRVVHNIIGLTRDVNGLRYVELFNTVTGLTWSLAQGELEMMLMRGDASFELARLVVEVKPQVQAIGNFPEGYHN